MKAKRLFAKIIRVPLPVLCYSITIIVWVLACLLGLLGDMLARRNGTLVQQTLAAADFRLVDMERLPDGSYRVLEGQDEFGRPVVDPQMILDSVPGRVRSVRLVADYSGYGYEMNVYYTTRPGAEFDKNLRVWPVLQDDGSYLFTLPRRGIERLRLDPASALVDIAFHAIVLNEPVPPLHYFIPGWAGLVALLLLPAFAAAALRWLADMFLHYAPKEKRKPRGKQPPKPAKQTPRGTGQ